MDSGTGIGPNPLCKCGCGSSVSWNDNNNIWREFIHGHHLVAKQNELGHGLYKGHTSPRKGKINLPKFECVQCKVEFVGKGYKQYKFCSSECFQKWEVGSNNPAYNSTSNYYPVVLVGGKNKRLSRVVLSAYLGKELVSTEIVHHIDKNKKNNDTSNLYLFHCLKCHSHFHMQEDSKTPVELAYYYDQPHKAKKYINNPYRRAMTKALGRTLEVSEVVHHIDNNRKNNDITNLFLFHCQKCHKYHHDNRTALMYKYEQAHQVNL